MAHLYATSSAKVYPQSSLQLGGYPQQQTINSPQRNTLTMVQAPRYPQTEILQSQRPLQYGPTQGFNSDTSQRIEVLEQKIALLKDFQTLNWFGLVVAIHVICAAAALIIYLLYIKLNSSPYYYTYYYYSLTMDGLYEIVGGLGVTIILYALIIFGHYYGMSGYKNFNADTMQKVQRFYLVLLRLAIAHLNVIWILIYYLLLLKSRQLENMFRELEVLKKSL